MTIKLSQVFSTIMLTYCGKCHVSFETEKNSFRMKNNLIYSATCPHCGYYYIISYNTGIFKNPYKKDMPWPEFVNNKIYT